MQCNDESYSREYFPLPASSHVLLLRPFVLAQAARLTATSDNMPTQYIRPASLLEFFTQTNKDLCALQPAVCDYLQLNRTHLHMLYNKQKSINQPIIHLYRTSAKVSNALT